MNAISNLDILVSCLLDAFVMLSGWADNATAKIFAPSAFGNRVKSSAAGLERSCQLFHTFQTSFHLNNPILPIDYCTVPPLPRACCTV
ncbi:hypothetical protein KC360_g182 [Hortaea werneckii]|nr:hypothetical protein KC360_g182 [Hortaea werneckii]